METKPLRMFDDESWESSDRILIYFEEERRMPYITSVERRGILKGQAAMAIRLLKRKLGELDPELETKIKSLEIEQIEALGEDLLDFASVDDLRLWLSNPPV